MREIVCDITDPADHFALDEALLLEADAGGMPAESIRIWQFDRPVVVLGRSSKVDVELDRAYCESEGIPIMRRCSGGAAIVGGPGCLMYSIVLNQRKNPGLWKIDAAHDHVMGRVVSAIRRQLPAVRRQGICDVTYGNRKCSGNSLRMAREHLLYHGTILYKTNLHLIASCLRDAPRQPEYRQRRDHEDFVTNILVEATRLRSDLLEAFGATRNAVTELPRELMAELRRTRYDNPAWHLRH